MSKPEAGQWWLDKESEPGDTASEVAVRIAGALADGRLCIETDRGIVVVWTDINPDVWHHEPRCTGWDWVVPADPTPPANQLDPDEWVVQDQVPVRLGDRGCRRRDLPPEQCSACDAPAEPGTAGCKDCNEYATAICSPEPETELDKLKRHYEHRGRRLEALTKKVRTLRRALTDYKKAQDAIERERQAEWMIHYAESLPKKPEPQPAKTRVRLWKWKYGGEARLSDTAPSGDWVEVKHDAEGFYVEGQQ